LTRPTNERLSWVLIPYETCQRGRSG